MPWLVILGGADPSPLAQAAIELPGEDVPAGSAQLLADWWARREAARSAGR